MRRAGTLFLLFSFALGGGACGASTEGTPGDPDAGETPDAEPLPDEDGGADARRDAAPDGPIYTGFCATVSPKPEFCDSFDDGDLDNDWDVLNQVNGIADLEPGEFRSSPASYAVGTPVLLNTQASNVSLRTTIEGGSNHVRFAVSTYFSQVTFTQGVVGIATIDVSSNHFFTVYLRDAAGNPTIEEIDGSTVTPHTLTNMPAPNTWSRLDVDIDLGGGTVTVKWDSATAFTGAIAAKPAVDPTIRVGAVYVYGPTPAFSALFDDVVLDF